MSSTKIDVSVGGVSFAGEGEQVWLAEQLDKVLLAATELSRAPANSKATSVAASAGRHAPDDAGQFTTSLSMYIKDLKGETNQVDRFLITADWLRRRGVAALATAAVSKALTDNQQKRLANPADCLNKNVSKGLCEKTGNGFYITPEGLKKLGYK
jgi:hypothetical protein